MKYGLFEFLRQVKDPVLSEKGTNIGRAILPTVLQNCQMIRLPPRSSSARTVTGVAWT